ncbi:MAG: hypothetical protein Q9212_003457 [Teloschistes hypoglaucus]
MREQLRQLGMMNDDIITEHQSFLSKLDRTPTKASVSPRSIAFRHVKASPRSFYERHEERSSEEIWD